MAVLVRANPLTYAIDLLRHFIIDYHEHNLGLDVGVVLVLTALACTLSFREFRR